MPRFIKPWEAVYHRTTGFPAGFSANFGRTYALEYTQHALNENVRDRNYPNFPLPAEVTVTSANVIEVTVHRVTKRPTIFVLRQPIEGSYYDICLVINASTGVVITTWANYYGDQHSELDTSRYERGEVFLD